MRYLALASLTLVLGSSYPVLSQPSPSPSPTPTPSPSPTPNSSPSGPSPFKQQCFNPSDKKWYNEGAVISISDKPHKCVGGGWVPKS